MGSLVLVLLQLCTPVMGHGNMMFPYVWWDVHQAGSVWDDHGANNNVGCGVLDLPDNEFSNTHDGKPPECFNFWFANNVRIPGDASIPDYMAENYMWHNPPVTEWKAGSFQEVSWYVGANHAGG